MQLDELVKKLCEEMELEGSLRTEVPGVFALPIDEGVDVNMTTLTGGGVSFTCTFGARPHENVEEFVTQALLANLLGNGTYNAVLGLDENGEKLRLSRDVETPLNYEQFHNILEDFINSIDFWTEEAQSYSSG